MLLWTLSLILVIIAYALLIVWALPNLILKSKYPVDGSSDRGLKKYKFNDSDYAVVYEPSLSARKYITQYVLAKRDGKKTIKCKFASGVSYVDFDIALFNAEDKCFSVIRSMDVVERSGLTEEINLPAETSYAGIIINQADDKDFGTRRTSEVSPSRLVCFGVLALIISTCMSVFSMVAFSNIFGGLFKETFAKKMLSSGWVFITPTLVCAVCIAIACYTLFARIKNSKG